MLFKRIAATNESKQSGLDMIKERLKAYVTDTGKELVTDEERGKDPCLYVQSLLDLKDKYDGLISSAFNSDKTFMHAVNEAFESFINHNNRSPEYLSLFVDHKMRQGLKGSSEEEVELTLDKVMMLFR